MYIEFHKETQFENLQCKLPKILSTYPKHVHVCV